MICWANVLQETEVFSVQMLFMYIGLPVSNLLQLCVTKKQICICRHAYIIVSAQLGVTLVFGDCRNTQKGSNGGGRTLKDSLVLLSF